MLCYIYVVRNIILVVRLHNVPTEYTIGIVVAQFSPPLFSPRNVAAVVAGIILSSTSEI